MIKKFIGTIILVIITMFTFVIASLAYEDELFEFDLPSNYANMSYQSVYIFGDTSGNSNRGFIIYVYENDEMKKSVWDISDDDLDYLIRKLGYSVTVINTDKKAKLGKEKAVKITATDSGEYADMYILASNKYIYLVMFFGDSTSDLNCADYEMIKDSFKLKDATTNYKAIFTVGFIIIIVVIMLFSSRRRPPYNPNHNIDYKNMTEEDFNIKQ